MVENKKLVNGFKAGKRKADYESNNFIVNDERSIKKVKWHDGKKIFSDSKDDSRSNQTCIVARQTASNAGAPILTGHIFSVRDYLLPKNEAGNPMLYVKDVQHLILYAAQGILSTEKPRWCSISNRQHLKSVFVAVVESASVEDLENHKNLMPFLISTFEQKFEVVSPSQYSGCALEELLMVEWGEMVPMSIKRKATVGNYDGFMASRNSKSHLLVDKENWRQSDARTTKLDLLLTSEEMKMEGYSIPLSNNQKTKNFKYSRKSYIMPTENSPMFAIDCEMVSTAEGRELASLCIVDENLRCIYSTYVKPDNEITDYNTRFSGITQETLENVNVRLCDVQGHLQNTLPEDVILVGQSLNFDLDALKLFHPFVIDTSTIYNLSGYKDKKSKLQLLAKLFLKREIQNEVKGHCAREDAEASMQLVLLKLNKGDAKY